MTEPMSAGPTGISTERLKRLIDDDEPFALLDTRDAESFEGWRIAGAIHFFYKPDHRFDVERFIGETGIARDDAVVTICAKGKASRALANELHDAGFGNVRYVDEGMRGWSSVYDTVDVETDAPVEIVQLQRRAKGCLGYVVADPETERAAVIDPTRHVERFREAAAERGFEIVRVLDTHIHADHVSGGRALADELGVPYCLGERVTERDLGLEYESLSRNEVIEVGEVEIKAVFTPGHTSGTTSYLVGSSALLTGDTVFVDGVGRTELQFGDDDAATGAELLYDSLHGTVLAEPDPITVLPGHFTVPDDDGAGIEPGTEVSTTIGRLRTGAPLLARDRESFVERILEAAPEKPPNYERIIAINRGRATAGEGEAIELELGPNRCAVE